MSLFMKFWSETTDRLELPQLIHTVDNNVIVLMVTHGDTSVNSTSRCARCLVGWHGPRFSPRSRLIRYQSVMPQD